MSGLVNDAQDITVFIIEQCTCMNECMIMKPSVGRRMAADVFPVQEEKNTTQQDPKLVETKDSNKEDSSKMALGKGETTVEAKSKKLKPNSWESCFQT